LRYSTSSGLIDPIEESENITDELLMTLLREISEDLFPPRHLFLLTADLNGIELEHATALMNDLSAEREAEILREYLEREGDIEEEGKNRTDASEIVLDPDIFSDSG